MSSSPLRRRPTRNDTVEEEHGSDLERLRAKLRAAEAAGLDPLPRERWLERLLSEWDVLRALPHIAPFHLHPVDVHSWRTVLPLRSA